MNREELIINVRSIVSEYLLRRGLELVELIYRYEGRNLFLRILVDKPQDRITIDECATINNDISRMLDEKDVLRERYILEVSSPGLDRPLKTGSDFSRVLGCRAIFFLTSAIQAKLQLEGVIVKVSDKSVCIDRNGEVIEIPFDKIQKAMQVIT